METASDQLRSDEYWYGQTVPVGTGTWIHGISQIVIGELLTEAGHIAGFSVELRIIADARPKPDVIATKGAVEQPYPTKAVDVVVEILSPDESMAFMIEKCRAYQAWGFREIYVVDPGNRFVFRWTGGAFEATNSLASVDASRIWQRLDLALGRKQA